MNQPGAPHVELAGSSGSSVMLVHGSGAPGWGTWEAQRPLADRFRLTLVHRSGYPPNPSLERIDFERQADEVAALIEPGMHLVGHSYGGVVSLLVAGRAGDRLRSLTVIEPPAFGVARGDPAVDALVEQITQIAAEARDPRAYVTRFAAAVGARLAPPDPLPPAVEAVIRASMAERPPWEAVIPFDAIRDAGLPVLVVSGGHHPAFDAVCDVLERDLQAERAVLPGSGHSVQRLGAPFNERVAAFIEAHSP